VKPAPLKICIFVATIISISFGSLAGAESARFKGTDFRQPDFFPIIPWDPFHGWDGKASDSQTNGLESIAACHFNFAGFVLPRDLEKCRRLGLGAIVFPGGENDVPIKFQREWKHLTDAQIEDRIQGMVKSAGSNTAIKGFFIMDEPSVTDFPALGKAVAALKKFAPGKWAYINLYPDYATLGAPDTSQLGSSNYTEYLERFVTEVRPQVLSYDNYMVQFSEDLKNTGAAVSYFRNLAEVRRVGQKYHLPCLQIVAANQLRPGHTIPTPANLLLQTYTTLAAGFRGVTWYTYYSRGYSYGAIGSDGAKTITWPYLQEVNRQVAVLSPVLRRLVSTGIYFSAPIPAPGLPQLPGSVIETVTSTSPMMIGEFQGTGTETFVMLVNLSLDHSAKFSIVARNPGESFSEISVIDGELRAFKGRQNEHWLAPGQGMLLKSGR
jgi:hypothetical protein